MSVSQDDKPRLFTIDGGNVNVDAAPVAPVLKGAIKGAGETALQVEPQPGREPRNDRSRALLFGQRGAGLRAAAGRAGQVPRPAGFAAAVSAYEILPAGISTPFALLFALAEVAAARCC